MTREAEQSNRVPRVLVDERIAAYRQRYDRVGGGLFSERTSGKTPLIEDFRVALGAGSRTVVEAGAGSGRQAVLLASRPETQVIAIEPNAAHSGIHETLATTTDRFGPNSKVAVVEADVAAVLVGLQEPIDGIHAHSLVHFWDGPTRAEFYRHAYGILTPDGLLAVSLKAEGDAQQAIARVVGRDNAGIYGKDPVDQGITRLFVSDPSAIAKELDSAGFALVDGIHQWEVPGYDFPDQPELTAKFVGFLAKKLHN